MHVVHTVLLEVRRAALALKGQKADVSKEHLTAVANQRLANALGVPEATEVSNHLVL